jgi:hypothetical protein
MFLSPVSETLAIAPQLALTLLRLQCARSNKSYCSLRQRLFSDTETAEDTSKQVIRGKLTGYLRKRLLS